MSARGLALVTVCAFGTACGRAHESSVDTPLTVAPATPAAPAIPAAPAQGVPYDSVARDRDPAPPGSPLTVTVEHPVTDSVRGVVAVVGSQPMTQVVVRPGDGTSSVRIDGVGGAGLASLSGADVLVRGRRTGQRLLVAESFSVRAVDGAPAVDGVLERSGDGYVLRLAGGSRRVVTRPSPALRERVGARVWVAGPADAEPQAFGVIEP